MMKKLKIRPMTYEHVMRKMKHLIRDAHPDLHPGMDTRYIHFLLALKKLLEHTHARGYCTLAEMQEVREA